MSVLLLVFEAYRLALRALVALMGLHFFASTLGFLRRRGSTPEPPPPAEWPRVTVQLPIRNEFYAATRGLEAAVALDYPRELLEIQVLDDSDDGTSERLADAVSALAKQGFAVTHLRREAPAGFKAGALARGLALARGEFVAMFDADFMPAPDFLRRTVVHFADPRVAMVQGSWAHRNREQNWLTRLQAQILDGLFIVEQTAKSRAGVPFQFNGTAGVWRRSAIEQAGGWTFDSLTEDLDLSIRAQLAGFRLLHLPEVSVACELPTSLAMFRVQQRRWALGTAQLLRKRFFSILRSSIPLRSRIAILTQLGRHFVHPLLLVSVVLVPVTTFYPVTALFEYGWLNPALLGLVAAGVSFQHGVAAWATGRSVLRAILLGPLVVPLAIGLAPTYTVALFYGLRDRAGEFFRTPKMLRAPRAGEPEYRPLRSWLVLAEIAIGLGYAYLTALAVSRGFYESALFLALVCAGYCWLGLGSLSTRPEVVAAPPSAEPVDAVSIARGT